MQWASWGGLALTILIIVAAFFINRIQPQESDLPVYWAVPGFALTNQVEERVTNEQLQGEVWVANIIFTRCPGPCAEMTRRMGEIQKAVPATEPVKFISLTTDPDYDSPEILKRYAERFGAQGGRWWFLTGSKAAIFQLAAEGLKLTAIEKKPEERSEPADLFIHSTIFVLVDKQGRVRGTVESLEEGWKEKILNSVASLVREKGS